MSEGERVQEADAALHLIRTLVLNADVWSPLNCFTNAPPHALSSTRTSRCKNHQAATGGCLASALISILWSRTARLDMSAAVAHTEFNASRRHGVRGRTPAWAYP
jgi:hypothetical protein